jgi:hypothetical protein
LLDNLKIGRNSRMCIQVKFDHSCISIAIYLNNYVYSTIVQ